MKISLTDIMCMALEAGFYISTDYGQAENKKMPASDYATLEAFAKLIIEAVEKK